jgi:hypothetical protein
MKNPKTPIKSEMETSHRRQKGRQKRPKDVQPAGTKEGRELVPLVVGSFLTHSSSNVISHM